MAGKRKAKKRSERKVALSWERSDQERRRRVPEDLVEHDIRRAAEERGDQRSQDAPVPETRGAESDRLTADGCDQDRPAGPGAPLQQARGGAMMQ